MNILVLGAGLVGRVIAHDLSGLYRVTSTDIDRERLSALRDAGIETKTLDVTDSETLARLAGEFDLVVGALPGFLGFQTIETVIRTGKNVVDISFSREDVLSLGELAANHGVVAIVDAGLAPGLDNLILGHHDRTMDVESFECLVGGLPKRRKWPFNYKAPFSPLDVIEEYTRPARIVENGRIEIKPALSERELLWFEEVGTLESFNTDGLRTLVSTMKHVPNMREKTLRYPGHAELILALKKSGFFSDRAIRIREAPVHPKEVTSRILMNEWQLEPGEPEFTVMRVTVAGVESGERVVYTYDLYDEYDPETGYSSMARTTAFTCTAMIRYLNEHGISEPGVYPLELVGRMTGGFGFTLQHLTERGVILKGNRRVE